MLAEGCHLRRRATLDFPDEHVDREETATLCPRFRDNVYAFYHGLVSAETFQKCSQSTRNNTTQLIKSI